LRVDVRSVVPGDLYGAGRARYAGCVGDREELVKHLEMIQAVIGRMGSNSFAVKTWAVGLIAGIFALAAADRRESPWVLLIALLPVGVFWYLDAFYLRQERLFRRLYDAVRTGAKETVEAGAFGMSTKHWDQEINLSAVFWSRTIAGLYAPLAVLVVGVLVLVLVLGGVR